MKNYVEIMMEVLLVTGIHGITMQDVVLELDFMPNGTTPGPATIGKFKIDTIERETELEWRTSRQDANRFAQDLPQAAD